MKEQENFGGWDETKKNGAEEVRRMEWCQKRTSRIADEAELVAGGQS